MSDDNTITVHISNIRSEINKAKAKEEYIKTIWGIGYKLEI
ncbi:winged helix-turn-helix domain-containing protein [Clostridium culturomicium]